MISPGDAYTYQQIDDIKSAGQSIGTSISEYQSRLYVDTRNLSQQKCYLVSCRQRLILPNPSPFDPTINNVTAFQDYPGLFLATVTLGADEEVLKSQTLLKYHPRTLNASVTTSNNTTDESSSAVSTQHSAGSTISQTNSFDLSVSAGIFGDLPTGGVGVTMGDSSTLSLSSEGGSAGSSSQENSSSTASSMSVKDWGIYAQVGTQTNEVSWVCGQEYPWNLIQFRNLDQGNVMLPAYVVDRLYDGTQVYPPSELSLFGIDFVVQATWLVVPNSPLTGGESINFSHTLVISYASHGKSGDTVTASIETEDPISFQSDTLDLPLLALDPLTSRLNAVVGFVADQFDVQPTSNGGAFVIVSETNDLLVRGMGFTEIMSTDFSAGTVQMTLYFKALESISSLSLYLKHWVTGQMSCQLSITINDSTFLTRSVELQEEGGGPDSVTTVALRYKDYSSVDYCDFLTLGLNTIEITVKPVDAPNEGRYELLALAIG